MAVSTPVAEIGAVGAYLAVYREAANGQTAVTIQTKFSKILAAFAVWAQAPSNATYGVYVDTVSAGVVTFKCTHAAETTNVYVLVFGHP